MITCALRLLHQLSSTTTGIFSTLPMHTLSSTIKTAVIPLPKGSELSSLFKHYSDKDWSMLLDSGISNHVNNEYDIMVADPIATVTYKNQQVEVTHKLENDFTQAGNDPIAIVQNLFDYYFKNAYLQESEHNKTLPFVTGAMGFFGYDLGRVYEQLPDKNANDLRCPDMAVGLYSWSIIKHNKTDTYYLNWAEGYPAPTLNQLVNLQATSNQTTEFRLTSNWQSNMDEQAYKQKIAAIGEYLRAGDCYQVNLAQCFKASFTGSPWRAYQTLQQANQSPFSAFINVDGNAILSISPERFLSVRNSVVETTPIKGTMPRHKNRDEDDASKHALLNSEKDRAENLMIVDLLRNDISKNCVPGSVNVPDIFYLESYPAVHHLVSKVKAQLSSDSTPLDLLRDAFPGGSITGAPKIRAMEIIDELEPDRRGVYCGSIGYIGVRKDMDSSICIRTLLCHNNQIKCWAGGGIVLDSDAASEYQECLDKVAKILPILATE